MRVSYFCLHIDMQTKVTNAIIHRQLKQKKKELIFTSTIISVPSWQDNGRTLSLILPLPLPLTLRPLLKRK